MTSSTPVSDDLADQPATEADHAGRSTRFRWTLQARLITTIVSVVAFIFIAVGAATGAILSNILQTGLDNKVNQTASQAALVLPRAPGVLTGTTTAVDVIESGHFEAGFLLIVRSVSGTTDGAYVDTDGVVVELSAEQVTEVIEQLAPQPVSTVTVDGLGTYRVVTGQVNNSYAIAAGLPLSQVTSTLAQIITTVALVIAGGLILLGLAVAFIVRGSLRPLRVVADTAERVASVPMSEGAVRIADRVPDAETDEHTEIGRVGHALNTLLDHVDSSLDARQRNEERMRRFVADASHELRTPLASIRGYSELSLRDPELSTNTEAALERIQAQSLRMTTLVEDLLLLARLDEGQELVYGKVDLTQMAIEAVSDARAAGPDHVWRVDLDETPVALPGDSARLHQVVANLLANARTHTPAGTEVTVSVVVDDDQAILSVHDNGPGIDPKIADELFERFSRADRSRARQTGGTGLGLSIARAIVHAHDGEITVDSKPGGTTFRVLLPLKATAHTRPIEAPESAS